jgi:hypothetical protein
MDDKSCCRRTRNKKGNLPTWKIPFLSLEGRAC